VARGHLAIDAAPAHTSRLTTARAAAPQRLGWTRQQTRFRLDRPPA